MADRVAETWVTGLGFPEGLRWHDGELWFSDFHTRHVSSVGPDGVARSRAYIAGQPSGLGFRPDGTPLVVSMLDRNLVALEPERRALAASLLEASDGSVNDMFVDRLGRAYISGFGHISGFGGLDPDLVTHLVFVDVDGTASKVGEPLHLPNGIVESADGRTLIVSESTGYRLTAFDVADDGSLSGRRVFADLDGRSPDGLAIDSEGAVWVACYINGEVIRVREGGEVLDRVAFPENLWVTACALGGPEGRTLYVSLADTTYERVSRGDSIGSIARVEVDVPA